MSASPRLEIEAAQVARRLIARHASVDAVLLFGSVARDEYTAWSDIDLFVVATSGTLTVRRLLTTSSEATVWPVGIVLHRMRELPGYLRSGTRFIEHLYLEGRVLEDRSGRLSELLSQEAPPVSTSTELETELERLSAFSNPARFNGNFLLCYARIYTIAKAIVMAKLADEGIFEFDRERAFAAFAERWPGASDAVDEVRLLRPFYALTNDRKPGPLPFDWRGDSAHLERSVSAARRLADA